VYHHKDVRRVIANGVEWAHSPRPERTDPVLLRYETEAFSTGHSYEGAMTN
jgi:trehalose utilization protein